MTPPAARMPHDATSRGPLPAAAPLTGALATVALPDVLQLLDLGRKTGVLAVDAGDGRRGLVRLVEGRVTAARYQDPRTAERTDDLLDAVVALLALPDGRFAFTAGTPRVVGAGPAADAAGVRVEALLMEALHRADERARVAGRPTPNDPPPRVPTLTAGEPTAGAGLSLRALHWAVLAAVDGARDVAAVAAATRRDAAAVEGALAELVAAGLVAFRDGAALPASVAPVPSAPARSSVR